MNNKNNNQVKIQINMIYKDSLQPKNFKLMQHNQWMLNSKFKIEYINLKCVKQPKNLI